MAINLIKLENIKLLDNSLFFDLCLTIIINSISLI